MHEVYLDNNATTLLSACAQKAILDCIEAETANPSSTHRAGERARRIISQARIAVGSLVGCIDSNAILFGSGATELNNWILSSSARRPSSHIVTSAVEHSSIRDMVAHLKASNVRVSIIPVDKSGQISIAELTKMLSQDPTLVSIQYVNNETGVVQPVQVISEMCASQSVPFHCDAAQAVGKLQVDSSLFDYLTFSAHKLHGPAGLGALYVRKPSSLSLSLIHISEPTRPY